MAIKLTIFFVTSVLGPQIGFGDAKFPAQAPIDAHEAPSDQYAGRPQMHGYAFSQFDGFSKSWNLVTTRYRRDSNELRFIYANKIAWQIMSSGKIEYPDGAVFGKIGYIAEKDPKFESSLVPSGAKRYQFMIKDRKKFADTGGWGYLIFNGKGQTFPGNPVDASKACAACHNLVPERGFVFAEPFKTAPFQLKPANIAAVVQSKTKIHFSDVKISEIAPELQRLLPTNTKSVRSLQGDLRKFLFEGTLNEIRPTLVEETLASHKPAVLVSENGELYSFVYVERGHQQCPENQASIAYGMTSPNPTAGNSVSERLLKLGRFCQ